MITGYRSAKTRRVHETGDSRGFRGLDGRLAAKRLDMLAAAPGIDEIPPLASIGLHKLSGVCDYHKG